MPCPPWRPWPSYSVRAFVQVLVHLHYFLHLDFSSANRWNLAALMFTVIIMALFVGGSLWILFSLYGRLM